MGLRFGFRTASRCRIGDSDISNEAVAATSNGFRRNGDSRGRQSLTDLVDRFVEPVVEIHERVRGPELILQFLATNDLAGALEQHRQDLEGLLLKPNSQDSLAQFGRTKIQLEHPETEPPANLIVVFHDEVKQR